MHICAMQYLFDAVHLIEMKYACGKTGHEKIMRTIHNGACLRKLCTGLCANFIASFFGEMQSCVIVRVVAGSANSKHTLPHRKSKNIIEILS